jgi:formamidopyrimidine-DNA glycosylase
MGSSVNLSLCAAAAMLRDVPELPEVEVTRRLVAPLLEDRTIARVFTTRPSNFFLTAPGRLRRRLLGRRVAALSRHGKYLVARLDDDCRVLLHLGMTGQLFGAGARNPRLYRVSDRALLPAHAPPAFEPDQHTHLRLEFADRGPAVLFRDPRKFGKVQHLEPAEPCARLQRLGVDALAAEPLDLWTRTRNRRVAIKSALLDQSLLAGVGNIYADEALHGAGIRPVRAAGRLSRQQWRKLLAEVQRIMLRSIAVGGTTISDFVHPNGAEGAFTLELRVYGRTGMPCPTCDSTIRRQVIGGRSSHFCPHCQR